MKLRHIFVFLALFMTIGLAKAQQPSLFFSLKYANVLVSNNNGDVYDTVYFKAESVDAVETKFGIFHSKIKVIATVDGQKQISEEHIQHRRDRMFIPTSLPLETIENIQCKDYSFIETIDTEFVSRYYLVPKVDDLPLIRIEEGHTTIYYN